METNQVILLNDLLHKLVDEYKNLTSADLKNKLNITVDAKNSNNVIFNRMINASKDSKRIKELLEKCNAKIKTVNLEWNNNLKESMSLTAFKYCDIINEDWENSTLREFFMKTTFVFVVFKKEINDCSLIDVKVWKMSESILESGVRDVWEHTKALIKDGKIVNYVDSRNRNITYFKASGDTKYIHVRPHARDKSDTYPLPVADKTTGATSFMKHSFWLNSSFIKKIVVDGKYYE